ncbi:MAG: zinc ribbon domain-containing protein [Terracidiphilus sp.]|nr:zinc ribbon domain-containing protein [Terracidiphilus sp.]
MAEAICCPSCGVVIQDGAPSCPFCGTVIDAQSAKLGDEHYNSRDAVEVPSVRSQSSAPSEHNAGLAALAMDRYSQAYLVARTINGIGGTIQTIAIIAGCVLCFAGLIFFAKGDFSEIVGIIGLLAGLVLGSIGAILGVLVRASGQTMKAHLDCAVNGSPFLNNAQRAKVMSLR